MDDFDALFEQYAEKADNEAKSASNRGSNFQNYEEIKWTGLETGKPSVFRIVGGPPDSGVTPYTAKNVNICWIVGDDGKKFKVIRPSISDDRDYIINRIISRICSPKWVNNEKTYPVKDAHPELFNLVEKNGLLEGDKRYIFERGWKGKEVLIANVIDRARMDEHRNLKHTFLLAKSITESNGNEYVDEGISSYGVNGKFSHLFRAYGSWEKYDIAIIKNGTMDNPYSIINASHSPFEVARDYEKYNISSENHLTDEEKSWEKYDLSKIYKITSVIKIYNRLRDTIKKIDYALGTNFYEDLETEYKAEKKRLDEENAKAEAEEAKKAEANSNASVIPSVIVEETVDTPEPVTRTRSRGSAPETTNTDSDSDNSNDNPGSNLPYYKDLPDDIKKKILSANSEPTTQYPLHWNIEWNCDHGELASCEVCGTLAPYDGVNKCPACGLEFE